MSIHIIPVNKLTPQAQQGVIHEFISRNGTDYGERESSPETNFQQVKDKLETGLAVLIFDDETETINSRYQCGKRPGYRRLQTGFRNR